MKKCQLILLPLLTMLLSGCTPLSLSEVLKPSDNSLSETDVPSTESSSEIEGAQTWSVDDDFTWQTYEYALDSYNVPLYVPTENPYIDIISDADKETFYTNNYKRASSYEDAMFRTEKGLISGDIIDTPNTANYPLNHLPNRVYRTLANYRINEGVYEYT
ncbi:MAG TPA: hypothetical protein PLQ55_05285, partial [Bacilli bacterium]|nr:hypothetical protein [Bacilli bacterium]